MGIQYNSINKTIIQVIGEICVINQYNEVENYCSNLLRNFEALDSPNLTTIVYRYDFDYTVR